jgi:Ni/Fe-hydrogenase 1 B-type cytochrome subunit
MVRFYALLRDRPPRTNGHNPLAGLAYLVVYLLFGLAILTGLGLLAWVVDTTPWTTLFGWTWNVMPPRGLRLVHFLLMFAFIAFTIHHVYSAVLIDREEHNGEIASIFTGYKTDMLEDEAPHDDPRGTQDQ